MDLAMITGNREAVAALERRGVASELSPKDAFLAACAFGNVLDDRPELTPEDHALLLKLAELGRTGGVRAMLEAGFDVAVKGESGETPLHAACFCGWADTVRVLLDHGARTDVSDAKYKATPLDWAMEGFVWHRNVRGDYVEVVRALMEAGVRAEKVRECAEADDVPADVREALVALTERAS
jgi:hypothetical protein